MAGGGTPFHNPCILEDAGMPTDLKCRVQDFPPELERVTNQEQKDFVFAIEVNTEKVSTILGEVQQLLVAQSINVRVG